MGDKSGICQNSHEHCAVSAIFYGGPIPEFFRTFMRILCPPKTDQNILRGLPKVLPPKFASSQEVLNFIAQY